MTRTLLLLLTLAAVAPPGASALGMAGYDGANPFNCTLQQAGKGTKIPDTHADPLCVEYDKTGQSVAPDLGIAGFLAGEPARFAYAGDKCFYYQRDHWRGAVVQDDEQTETYNWDGGYFIDRARGVGGAAVDNFTLFNASADPTAMPGFPADWKPYFSYGRGGVQFTDSYAIDPACAARAAKEDVYAHPATQGSSTTPSAPAASAVPARRARPRIALLAATRRCGRSTLTVVVAGADRARVRRVVFRLGSRTLRRDTRAPFTVRVTARRAARLRAVAVLADGRRVTLRAPRRRAGCRS